NAFENDPQDEIEAVGKFCAQQDAAFAVSRVHAKGGAGGLELADAVLAAVATGGNEAKFCFDDGQTPEEKIRAIVRRVYGGRGVIFTPEAKKDLKLYKGWGHAALPVCMAKTQYSLSDNPKLLGEPKDFDVTVRRVRLSAGAGFLVALTGEIMTLPGLPKVPSAVNIRLDEGGVIEGLS
ncbi:MAG: formate--tetrahydrofolate ligase, partial [Clostridia bacterium]|nr:formate--tetrahydrofolate ligase [Clostridia bacterium]